MICKKNMPVIIRSDMKEPGVRNKGSDFRSSTPRSHYGILRNDVLRKSFPGENCRRTLSKQLSGSFEEELSFKQSRHIFSDSDNFSKHNSKSQKYSPSKEHSPTSRINRKDSNELYKDYSQNKDNVFQRLSLCSRNILPLDKQKKTAHSKHRTKENNHLSSSSNIKLPQTVKFATKSDLVGKNEKNDQYTTSHKIQRSVRLNFSSNEHSNGIPNKNGILHHSDSTSNESISKLNERNLLSEMTELRELSYNIRPKLLLTPPIQLGGPSSAFSQLSPRQVSDINGDNNSEEGKLSKNGMLKQLSRSQGSIATSPVSLWTEDDSQSEHFHKSFIKKKQIIQVSNISINSTVAKISPQLATNFFTPIQGYPPTPQKPKLLMEANTSQNSSGHRKTRTSLTGRCFKKDTFPMTVTAVKKAERLLLDAHQEELQESTALSREELKLLQSVRHGQRTFSEYLKILDDIMSTKIQVIETLRSQISEVSLYRKHMSPRISQSSIKNS